MKENLPFRRLLIALLLGISVTVFSQDTVLVTRFGYEPGSRENAVPAVNKAIAFCKTLQHPVLVFPKGRYDFWPQFSTEKKYYESNTDVIPVRTCAIVIENMPQLTLDGAGSEFVYHGHMQPITIDKSSNVVVKKLSIDWDIPLTAQAKVVAVGNEYFDIEINAYESPYVIENNKLVFVGEGWKSAFWEAMEFDGQTKLLVPQTGDEALGNGWSKYKAIELKKGLVRLQYAFTRKPAVGNWLVLRHSTRDHAGIFIVDSKYVDIDHVNVYHTSGLGILSQYSSDLSFTNVHCVPNAAKGRVLSGHDDGLHFSNCKGKIRVDSCAFAGLMDDPINVHGTSVQVTKIADDHTLECRFVHNQSIGFTWAQAGDKISFIENEAMNSFASGEITSFQLHTPETFTVRFKDALPAALQIGDALENLTWTPDIDIRNSYFGSCRARGVLISTPGHVLIENNVFESSGTAILVPGDANGWYESGAVKDLTIRNNIFKEACLSSNYQFCEGIISIYPEIPKPDVNKPFHSNIIITGNTFHAFDYPVLYAKSVKGLQFNNNIIHRSANIAAWHPRHYTVTLEKCQLVQVLKNQIDENVLGKNMQLSGTNKKQVKTDFTQVDVVK